MKGSFHRVLMDLTFQLLRRIELQEEIVLDLHTLALEKDLTYLKEVEEKVLLRQKWMLLEAQLIDYADKDHSYCC
jgi:hypothetical protein